MIQEWCVHNRGLGGGARTNAPRPGLRFRHVRAPSRRLSAPGRVCADALEGEKRMTMVGSFFLREEEDDSVNLFCSKKNGGMHVF